MLPRTLEAVLPLLRMRYNLTDREIPVEDLGAEVAALIIAARVPGSQVASFTATVEGRDVRVLAVAGPKEST